MIERFHSKHMHKIRLDARSSPYVAHPLDTFQAVDYITFLYKVSKIHD